MKSVEIVFQTWITIWFQRAIYANYARRALKSQEPRDGSSVLTMLTMLTTREKSLLRASDMCSSTTVTTAATTRWQHR